MLETSNCVNCSRQIPKLSAKYVYHTGTLVSSTPRAGTSYIKKEGRISNYTMDFLSVPEYVIKKGRPHGHRYGKKPGDKEYSTANQLKKKCKKKYFQGIHDRFVRDPEFRRRMIENNRDEELCRKWDALADEDRTHLVTPQEYSLYLSNWWLHSNILCERRTDLTSERHCQPCSNRNKKKESYKRPRTLTETNNGRKVLLHGGIGKILGGLLIPMKVTMEMKPSTDRTVRPVVQYLEQFFRARLS